MENAAPPVDTDEHLRAKARDLSIKEGCTYGVMDGFGLRNITPFALAMGATNSQIGFLTSIPALFGNLTQLLTPKVMEKISRRTIVSIGVIVQAAMWLPITLIGLLYFTFGIRSELIVLGLILFYTLLVLVGAFLGPAWNSWMKDIVTTERGRYFGLRNRTCGAIALVAAIVGALILDATRPINLFVGFAILFIISFIFRSIGGVIFTRKYEPSFTPDEGYYFSFGQFLRRMWYNNFGKFTIYVTALGFAVNIASPFITVYMLKQLGFSYVQFTLVTMGSAITGLLTPPAWGKLADKYGSLNTIRICGVIVASVPLLWALSPLIIPFGPYVLIPFLFIVDSISGFAWAGHNMAVNGFTYDAVTRSRVSLCTAYMNVLNGFGVFLGAALGGLLTSYDLPLGAFIFVFVLSGILRLMASLLLARRVREVREVRPFDKNIAKEKILALSPTEILKYLELKN